MLYCTSVCQGNETPTANGRKEIEGEKADAFEQEEIEQGSQSKAGQIINGIMKDDLSLGSLCWRCWKQEQFLLSCHSKPPAPFS